MTNLDHNLALGIYTELQDLDLLETYRWSNVKGYAKTKIDGKTVYLHSLVHSRMTGKPLSEYARADHVRHIERNPFDCRRSNLFAKTGATPNQCDLNIALRSTNNSGISGVSWCTAKKKWKSQLGYLSDFIYLGLYDTIEQAALVANHCRVVRAKITCSETPMDFATMKQLLLVEARNILLQG